MNKNKTILQICVEGNTGSTGRMAEDLGSLMIEKGWSSHIAFGRFPRLSNSNLIRIGNRFEIIFHGILTRIFDLHGLGSYFGTKKLIKNIRRIKPDLIHLHHLHGYYINIKVLFDFLKKENIPVVWTFHDFWSITGHCTHFDYVNCNKWQIECNSCPQKMEYPASFVFDASKFNFHFKKKLFTSIQNLYIVNVSNWADEIISKSFLKKTHRSVIYNGVNIDVFKPKKSTVREKLKIGDGDFIILGVSSPWSSKKGINDFLKLSQLIDEKCKIILIGLSKELIKKMPHNIIGIEKVENVHIMADYYSAADLFINFSVEETFGLTTAESLACGTPVLVWDKTASPELLDYRTGFIAKYMDFKYVIKVIKIIQVKSKLSYSNACRERAKDLFDRYYNLNSYIKFYDHILNK